jgi:hypothetical protein
MVNIFNDNGTIFAKKYSCIHTYGGSYKTQKLHKLRSNNKKWTLVSLFDVAR